MVAYGVSHIHNNVYKFLLILENILHKRKAWHFAVSKCGAEIANQTLLLDGGTLPGHSARCSVGVG